MCANLYRRLLEWTCLLTGRKQDFLESEASNPNQSGSISTPNAFGNRALHIMSQIKCRISNLPMFLFDRITKVTSIL
jgi:hypothetical protein